LACSKASDSSSACDDWTSKSQIHQSNAMLGSSILASLVVHATIG
jgi:hypothetical protein